MRRLAILLLCLASPEYGQASPEAAAFRDADTLFHHLESRVPLPWNAIATPLGLQPSPDRTVVSVARPRLDVPGLALLPLTDDHGKWVFLRFRGTPPRFDGALEADRATGGRPWSISRSAGRAFLRLPTTLTMGSGLALTAERWWDLSQDHLEPIFELPLEAHEFRPARLDRLVDLTITMNTHEILANARLRFATNFGAIPLGELNCQARYQITAAEIRLEDSPVPCGKSTTMPRADFLSLIDYSGPQPPQETLLRYALPALEARAATATSAERDWLRELLRQAPDIPPIRRLRNALP